MSSSFQSSPIVESKENRNAPVFMFGFDRSGTTLLSMMTGAHPQLSIPFSTTGLWYRYSQNLSNYNNLRSVDDVARVVDDLLQEERIKLWNIKLSRDEILEGLEVSNFGMVVAKFHEAFARRNGKPRWGSIDISTIDHVDLVNQWFPDSLFLHIVRDGRDVALSHESYAYGLSNTLECAWEWRRRVERNLGIGAILGANRYKVVRYEDLVLDSENTLRDICRYIDIEFASEMLEYHKTVEKRVPKEKRWLWPTLNQEPVKANAFKWKQEMSLSKRVIFESNSGDLLKTFGYEYFDHIPKRIDAYFLEFWQFLGRGGRFKRLAAKFRSKAR